MIWLIFFYGNYRPVISLTQSRCCCVTEINGWHSSEGLFSLVFIHRDPEKLLEISHFKLREVQNTCRCPFKFIEWPRYFVYILWFLHAVTRLGANIREGLNSWLPEDSLSFYYFSHIFISFLLDGLATRWRKKSRVLKPATFILIFKLNPSICLSIYLVKCIFFPL